MVWGFSVIADSAQLSAVAATRADPRFVASTLAFQLTLGYLAAAVSLLLVTIVVEAASWRVAFALRDLGPAVGVRAMKAPVMARQRKAAQSASRSGPEMALIRSKDRASRAAVRCGSAQMAIAVDTTFPAGPLAEHAEVFKALCDPVRMDLFLRIAGVSEIACTEIVIEAGVSASTVSYHVKILKSAGLVAVRKEGRNFHYTARLDTVATVAGLLEALVAHASTGSS